MGDISVIYSVDKNESGQPGVQINVSIGYNHGDCYHVVKEMRNSNFDEIQDFLNVIKKGQPKNAKYKINVPKVFKRENIKQLLSFKLPFKLQK